MVALNKLTGDLIWKSPIPGGDRAAYSSITIADVKGVKEYVQFLQKGVVGVNAKTGEFLGATSGRPREAPPTSPRR